MRPLQTYTDFHAPCSTIAYMAQHIALQIFKTNTHTNFCKNTCRTKPTSLRRADTRSRFDAQLMTRELSFCQGPLTFPVLPWFSVFRDEVGYTWGAWKFIFNLIASVALNLLLKLTVFLQVPGIRQLFLFKFLISMIDIEDNRTNSTQRFCGSRFFLLPFDPHSYCRICRWHCQCHMFHTPWWDFNRWVTIRQWSLSCPNSP